MPRHHDGAHALRPHGVRRYAAVAESCDEHPAVPARQKCAQAVRQNAAGGLERVLLPPDERPEPDGDIPPPRLAESLLAALVENFDR